MNEMNTRYYKALYEVSRKVNSKLQVDEVLDAFVGGITEAMDAKGCVVMLLSSDKKQLIHKAACGLSDKYIKKGPVDVDASMSEALQGKVVAVPNVLEDSRIQYREEAIKEGISSILSVPMLLKDEIIGVIRVYTGEERHFSLDDMYFAGVVANLAGIAIGNAQLYESVKKDFVTLREEILKLATHLESKTYA